MLMTKIGTGTTSKAQSQETRGLSPETLDSTEIDVSGHTPMVE